MFSTTVRGSRSWRAALYGIVIAGLLLGAPFTSNPGSQCYAKGGGHHSHHGKGHKARLKRHGPKRHHNKHHSAKKNRHKNRRHPSHHKPHHRPGSRHPGNHPGNHPGRHPGHHPGGHAWRHDFSRNPWRNYWGGYYDNFSPVGPVVVSPGPVVGPDVVAPPTSIVDKVFVVKFSTKDGKNHVEQIHASTQEQAKEKVREKHPRAVFKSVEEK